MLHNNFYKIQKNISAKRCVYLKRHSLYVKKYVSTIYSTALSFVSFITIFIFSFGVSQ